MPDKILNSKKLILLDRDGVINFDSDNYIKSIDEWIPIPGSLEAIVALNKAKIDVYVITNQSGIGRGFFSLETLNAIHAKMENLLAALGGHFFRIDFCPHLPSDNCICRKPNTGLLDRIENEYNISLEDVPFVGDSKTDIELAFKKHCLPVLVKTGKGNRYFEEGLMTSSWEKSTLVFDNLEQASKELLAKYF